MRDRRVPYIKERLLFGPHTCRIGLCGQDGTCGTALPGVQLDGKEVWTMVYFCEKHAAEAIQRHMPKKKTKSVPA